MVTLEYEKIGALPDGTAIMASHSIGRHGNDAQDKWEGAGVLVLHITPPKGNFDRLFMVQLCAKRLTADTVILEVGEERVIPRFGKDGFAAVLMPILQEVCDGQKKLLVHLLDAAVSV